MYMSALITHLFLTVVFEFDVDFFDTPLNLSGQYTFLSILKGASSLF